MYVKFCTQRVWCIIRQQDTDADLRETIQITRFERNNLNCENNFKVCRRRCRRRCRRLYLLSSHISRLVHCSTTFYSTYIPFFTVHYYVFTVQLYTY